MNKIQEAFQKHIETKFPKEPEGLPDFRDWVNDMWHTGAFQAGYKAAEEKLKCCGNCKFSRLVSTGLGCSNPELTATGKPHDYNVVILEGVCDKWEARE